MKAVRGIVGGLIVSLLISGLLYAYYVTSVPDATYTELLIIWLLCVLFIALFTFAGYKTVEKQELD